MKHGLFVSVLALVPVVASPARPRVQLTEPSVGNAPLDEAWIAGLGKVSVFMPYGGPLRVEIDNFSHGDPMVGEKDNNVVRQSIDLDSLPANAHVQSARIGPLMTTGFVVALAVKEGESTAYHYLQCLRLPAAHELLHTSRLDRGPWSLSDALFTTTGEPYRIVDARGTNPGDGLEITFRRGWQKPTPNFVPTVDEKVYFNSCALAGAKTGAGILIDVEKFRPSH